MAKPIISFIVLILSIGFAFFYVVPEYNLVQSRKNDIVSLTTILSNSSKIKTLIDQTTENLNSVDANELSRFSVFLPETIDGIRFANNLQHIGLANGIVLADIKVETPPATKDSATANGGAGQALVNTFSLGSKIDQAQGASSGTLGGAPTVSKNYKATKASFTLVATYESFQLFLNNLEKSLGLINVTSLAFQPVPETPSAKKVKVGTPQIYQYAVSIETYSLK